MTSDQFAGCLLGLALGDALGAPFEGGLLERLAWRFLGRTAAGHARWTDDTQMTKDWIRSTSNICVLATSVDPSSVTRSPVALGACRPALKVVKSRCPSG